MAATERSGIAPDTQRRGASPVVLAVLNVALDVLRVPALVADRDGGVILSNVAARALLRNGSTQAPRSLPPPSDNLGWCDQAREITSLASAGLPEWFLVVLRTPEMMSRPAWKLTARQAQVLELVTSGMTNVNIAESLGIRPVTVEFHISAIFDKVGVSSRAALIATVIGGHTSRA